MTDDQIIRKMAIAMCHECADGTPCNDAPCVYCKNECRTIFDVAKPLIRAQMLDERQNNKDD